MRTSRLLVLLPLAVTASLAGACSSSPDAPREVTFHTDIEPLVQSRCQGCHNADGIAPMPLVTFDDVKQFGRLAAEKVRDRVMPPWGAYDDSSCSMKHKLRDDLRLTDEQVALFDSWVAQGMKEGDPALAPPKQTYGKATLLGATNTLGMKAPYTVKPGQDDIRCFPIDPGFAEDTYIGGSNVLPGNPRVVHHVIVYTDPKQQAKDKVDASGSYPCFGSADVDNQSLVLAWAPGVPPTGYGDNAGLKLPAKTHLVLQVHYHPTDRDEQDDTKFELRALAQKPFYETMVLLAGNASDPNGKLMKLLPGEDDPPQGPKFYIPPGKEKHVEKMELTIPEQFQGHKTPTLRILASGSHMHWAGVDMKIDIERKDPFDDQPKQECLLGTPKYDFNWQRAYQYVGSYEELPTIGPGDRVTFTCTYNNTTSNPYVRKALAEKRLSAPVAIELGEQTLDEMCLGAFLVLSPAF